MTKIKWSKEGYKRILEAQERGRQTQRKYYREKYFKNPKRCLYCKEIISYENRRNDFCNHSCAATKANLDRGFKSREKSKCFCKNCGKIIFNKTYCSHKCQQKVQHDEYIKRWLSGKEGGLVGKNYTISSHIRHYVMNRADYICEFEENGIRCDWNLVHSITGRYILHIHHIDWNFMNNRPENLLCLCPNHHYMTENMGALNKGNGRKYRYSNIA